MTDMSPDTDQRDVTSIQIVAPEEPPQKAKWRSLFYFTTRKHAVPLALAAIFTIASGAMVPMIAILLGRIFDAFSKFGARAITTEDLMHEVSTYCFYLVGLGVITWLLQGGYFAVWLAFGELQAKNARERLFSELLNRDLEWFETREDGVTALLPRLQTQIWELQMATAQPLGSVLQNIVACLTALGIALYTSWRLTLVSVASIPVCAGIVAFLSSKLQPSIQAHSEALSKASRLASTAISAVDTIKYFNGQSFETSQYVSAIKTVASKYIRQARFHALEIGCVQFMIFIMFVQGFWYGSHLVDTDVLSAGQVLTAFWASLQATKSIDQSMPHLIVLEKGRAASTALRDVLENKIRRLQVRDMTGAISPAFCEGEIRMRHVTFAYPSRPDCYVLRNTSLSFRAGDTTFVVGKSGSGKSTLGNLLLRFYAPKSGEIFIDGNPIQTLSQDWIRNNITLVQQQSVLFNETIFRNIAFGSRDYENVTQTQMLECLDFASLHNTIRNQPRGLETIVGVGGTSLSGGQRQRIALARARLRDTPVLILDESTSALDYAGRTLIMDAIRTWRKGKTTIIITHDMSQIHDEDFVYMMEAGQATHKGYNLVLKSRFGDMSVDAQMESPPPYDGSSDSKDPESQHFRFGSSVAKANGGRNKNNLSIAVSRPESSVLQPSTAQEFTLQDFSSPILSPGLHRRPQFRNAPNILSAIEPVEFPELSDLSSQYARRKSYAVPSANHIELAELYSARTVGPNFSVRTPQRSATSFSFYTSSEDDFEAKKETPKSLEPRRYSSVHSVLFTVFPSLDLRGKCLLVLGFIAALVHAAATPLFSYFFSQLLGTFFLTENRSRVAMKWSLLLIADSIANALGSFFMNYLLERCGEAWINKLRGEAVRRILSQPREWFERAENKATALIAALDRSAEDMRNLVGKFAGFIFVAMVIMIMSITWGTAICWKLALVGLACAPVLYGFTRAFEAVTSRWETRCNDSSEVIAGVFSDTFLDIRTVRALTLEGYFHNKVLVASFKSLKLGLKRACYAGFFYGLSDSSIIFVYTLVFYYGAILASTLAYTTKDILTVFSMLLFGMSNVNAVLMFVPQIGSSRDTASRVLRLATLPDNSSHEHQGSMKMSYPTPVNFKDVNFSYPSRREQPVLHNFNLTIAENTCTAIVGPSGSGKSTVASLLLSLYPVDGANGNLNSISLGGLDINKIHVPTLRTLITIVPQQPTLFPVSIRANIIYGLEESSPLNTTENIKAAAQAAGIDEFITSLPQGYDTMIGDGNVGLSGGQAQRIIIARALVRRPRILILDEATSNLDPESARLVRNTVKKLTASKDKITVVIITHAKEMMEIADKIVVVDDGTVVEEGGYEELIKRKGGQLWKLLSSTLE